MIDKWGNDSDVERSERTQCCQWQHISPAKQSATTRHSGLVKGRLRNSRQKPGIRLKTLHEICSLIKLFHLIFGNMLPHSNDLEYLKVWNCLVSKCKCWFLALCSPILSLQDLVIKEVRWSTNKKIRSTNNFQIWISVPINRYSVTVLKIPYNLHFKFANG